MAKAILISAIILLCLGQPASQASKTWVPMSFSQSRFDAVYGAAVNYIGASHFTQDVDGCLNKEKKSLLGNTSNTYSAHLGSRT